jgi:hypothetical protein
MRDFIVDVSASNPDCRGTLSLFAASIRDDLACPHARLSSRPPLLELKGLTIFRRCGTCNKAALIAGAEAVGVLSERPGVAEGERKAANR